MATPLNSISLFILPLILQSQVNFAVTSQLNIDMNLNQCSCRYQYDSWNDCHDELCSGNQYAITKNNKPSNAMLRFLLPTLLDAAAALQVCRTAPSPSRFLVPN